MVLRTQLSKLLQRFAFWYLRNGRLTYLPKYEVHFPLHPNIFGYCILLEKFAIKRYEKGAMELLRKYALEGDILDVGANEGYYSICLGVIAANAGNRVYSVEPLPLNLERLSNGIAANSLTDVVDVIPFAAGNMNGNVTLFVPSGESGSYATTRIDSGIDISKSISVPVKRLDDLLDLTSERRISLIKIDVEGAELEVLLGAYETLKKYKPAIFLELEENRQPKGRESVDKILELLSVCGYCMYSHKHNTQILPFNGVCGSGHNLFALAKG